MKTKTKYWIGALFLIAFVLWTVLLRFVDVRAIGPLESKVGFSALNGFFHELTGVHLSLYVATDWLGLVPFGIAFTFGILGLVQWIKRKRLWAVDRDILALGIFYIIVIAVYAFFESVVINYRPVLIDGILEASYPSSTTMLAMCVMPTAMMQLRARIKNITIRRCVVLLLLTFTAFMVVGRILSGVHWITDIIGGAMFSTGLICIYGTYVKTK